MNAWRDLWLRAALVLSALTPLCFLTAAFGVKYQIFGWDFGVGVLTLKVLPVLASFGLTAALIALVLSWTARPLRRRRLALISTLAPAVALAIYFVVTSSTARLPPIHDISTDLADPPGFSPTVAAERALLPGGNGLDLIHAHVPNVEGAGQASGLRVTAVQKAAYPDIAPIATGAAPSRALAAARGVAPKLGWVIGRVDEQAGVMEARHVEFWFGAVSDIVVRVTPADPGSVIDVRSVSRQGVGDLGANAARVRAFAREIARELSRG
jgi:uncharacterized protein (DUF1499 family)